MNVDVLLGLQWGDEGKGKIVDSISEKYSLIARFQGGQMQVTQLNLIKLSMYFILYHLVFLIIKLKILLEMV